MMYRVFSKTHPGGVLKDQTTFVGEVVDVIDQKGVYRGECSCCGLRIVVRAARDHPAMTANDQKYVDTGVDP